MLPATAALRKLHAWQLGWAGQHHKHMLLMQGQQQEGVKRARQPGRRERERARMQQAATSTGDVPEAAAGPAKGSAETPAGQPSGPEAPTTSNEGSERLAAATDDSAGKAPPMQHRPCDTSTARDSKAHCQACCPSLPSCPEASTTSNEDLCAQLQQQMTAQAAHVPHTGREHAPEAAVPLSGSSRHAPRRLDAQPLLPRHGMTCP